MLRTEVFHPDHAMTMQLREADAAFVEGLGTFSRAIAQNLSRHPAITIMSGPDVVCCGGVILFWPGVGEAWMRTSPLIENFPVAVLKSTRTFLKAAFKAMHLRRLQCTVRQGYAPAIKWAEHLGFEREGILKAFGPDGADYVIFSRRQAWR
jgi:hypothetical protein